MKKTGYFFLPHGVDTILQSFQDHSQIPLN